MKKLLSMVLSLSLSALSGCFTSVDPSSASPAPHAPRPSSVSVGLVSDSASAGGNFYVWYPQFAQTASQTIAPAMPQKLASAMRQSGLFQQVDFPPAYQGGDDLILTSRFNLTYKASGMWVLGAIVTGLTIFMLAPFIYYHDHYNITGDLSVSDARGAVVKEYHETGSVSMLHPFMLGGFDELFQQGADVAVGGIVAKLVSDLVQDQSDFEKAGGTAAAPAQRRKSAKRAQPQGAGGAWWQTGSDDSAPAAAPAPAPASAEDAPKPAARTKAAPVSDSDLTP